MPIKAWNKDGEEIKVKDMVGDDDIEEGFSTFLQLFSLISQKYKTIITKVELEGKEFTITVEQK